MEDSSKNIPLIVIIGVLFIIGIAAIWWLVNPGSVTVTETTRNIETTVDENSGGDEEIDPELDRAGYVEQQKAVFDRLQAPVVTDDETDEYRNEQLELLKNINNPGGRVPTPDEEEAPAG